MRGSLVQSLGGCIYLIILFPFFFFISIRNKLLNSAITYLNIIFFCNHYSKLYTFSTHVWPMFL